MVDDNFHPMDEAERYEIGVFNTWDEAVAASKQIVDEHLSRCFRPGITAEQLYQGYQGYGEDPFVVVVPPDTAKGEFSAWLYAEQRSRELCGSRAD
jgi:hypothetical protein